MQAPPAGAVGFIAVRQGIFWTAQSAQGVVCWRACSAACSSPNGLKKSLMVMALYMNIPHLCFVYLSHAVPPTALTYPPSVHLGHDREVRLQLRLRRQHAVQ